MTFGVIAMDGGQVGRPIFFGLVGMVVGSVSAEVHHCRRRRGPTTADLAPRRFVDYAGAGDLGLLGGIGAIAVVVAAVGLAASGGRASATVGWATTAVLVVAIVVAMQLRVVSRRRPSLPDELRQADDLMRRLSVTHGLAHPGATLGLGLLGNALTAAGMPIAGLVCWLLAIGSWWANRRVGLDHVLRSPPVAA
jgi:hypothetical protein